MIPKRSQPAVNGESREAILTAALRAFSERGFDGASTRDIATAAGVNHGLIPYYFGSKDKLWRAAVDRAFAAMRSELDEALAAPGDHGAREQAARAIRAHVYYVAKNPEFVRLMHEEGKRRGPRSRYIVDHHVRPLFESITRRLGPAVFPTDVPAVHYFYILAGAAGTLFHQAEECKRLTGVDAFDPAVVERHAALVERLFLGDGLH